MRGDALDKGQRYQSLILKEDRLFRIKKGAFYLASMG